MTQKETGKTFLNLSTHDTKDICTLYAHRPSKPPLQLHGHHERIASTPAGPVWSTLYVLHKQEKYDSGNLQIFLIEMLAGVLTLATSESIAVA